MNAISSAGHLMTLMQFGSGKFLSNAGEKKNEKMSTTISEEIIVLINIVAGFLFVLQIFLIGLFFLQMFFFQSSSPLLVNMSTFRKATYLHKFYVFFKCNLYNQ